MGWQEELRRLDAELASGAITHSQHRRLRDELLASVSGGTVPSPKVAPRQTESAGTAWAATNPASTPPAPEPTRAPEGTEPPGERMSFSARLRATERPTTAPSPADNRPTEVIPNPFRQQRQPARPPAAPAPPLDLRSPEPDTPPGSWPVPAEPRHRGLPTWLLIACGVLIALMLVIAGAWWLGADTDQPAAQSSQGNPGGTEGTAPTATTTRVAPTQVPLADRLPALPGEADTNNSTMSVEKGRQLGLYSAEAAVQFTENGADQVIYQRSAEGDDGYLVLIIPTAGPENAQAVLDYLYRSALTSGFTETQASERAVTGSNENGRMLGSWYTSGSMVVSVWVSQALNSDATDLRARSQRTVESVRDVLPGA
ncbi:hypothetical protein [Amycolatopsis aidingensis]|uniref:hypothetical protein n=1 Tax=Amycolatopsis aidingensis TaxID=2842453 RepID=UPI001C0BBBE3|nr:hypothetical protein [Amycolatopsis aidingensis]